MPACMNDCMNCFWKSKNPNSKGATAISVPALITAQSTPERIGKSIRPWPLGAARFAHCPAPWPRCDGAQWRLCRLASRYW